MSGYYLDVLLLITIQNIPVALVAINGMVCNKATVLKHLFISRQHLNKYVLPIIAAYLFLRHGVCSNRVWAEIIHADLQK